MLKKTFWISVFLLSTLCAYLAADLTTIYLKKIWDAPPITSTMNTAKEKSPEQGKKLEEYYKIIAKRDLFQIHPPKVGESSEEEEKVAPITDLKLKLLGTAVGKGIVPYAIIKDLRTQKQICLP